MSAPDADSDATLAVYLDLENIVIGSHEANFPPFDIRKVLERLLLKGHIVVKKAYCDSIVTKLSSAAFTKQPSS
jgi:hypothetical protein